MSIVTVTGKYNRSYGRSFAAPGAIQKYLHPIGLSLHKKLSPDFATNQTRFSAKEEQEIFKAIHFCRWHITNGNPRLKWKWEKLHEALRSRAVNANMGLVYKCIEMRHKNQDFDELSSAGRFALLRSVDGFDPWKGFRFSTYACIAILQAISRELQISSGKFNYQSDIEPDDILVKKEQEEDEDDGEVIQKLRKSLENGVLSRREKRIIRDRFGLGSSEPKTLLSISEKLKISRERVRQIQLIAFNKLKESLDKDSISV